MGGWRTAAIAANRRRSQPSPVGLSQAPVPLRPAEASVLGLLAVAAESGECRSGYDLMQATDASTGYFWSAAKSQVYTVLYRLRDRGLVSVELVEQDVRPDKNVYSITDLGQRSLRAWLDEPVPAEASRNVHLLRLFFGSLANPEQVTADIEAQLAHARDLRGQLGRIEERAAGEKHETVYRSITRRYGLAWADMVEKWATEALEMLEKERTKPGRSAEKR